MKTKFLAILLLSNCLTTAFGFALGIYFLPILTAPPSPTSDTLAAMANEAVYQTAFTRNLAGSDALHWGEGEVAIGNTHISLSGKLAPGPDYKLYLSPKFVETEEQFNAIKSSAKHIADVKTFDNFLITVPDKVNINDFNTVVIWCESFGEFITAAKYK